MKNKGKQNRFEYMDIYRNTGVAVAFTTKFTDNFGGLVVCAKLQTNFSYSLSCAHTVLLLYGFKETLAFTSNSHKNKMTMGHLVGLRLPLLLSYV